MQPELAIINTRPAESFSFTKEITKPFGGLDRVLAWSKTELVGDWRWQLIEISNDHKPGRYMFYFDLERDLFAFTLQWA